jgi:toxin ParE1/3/4
MSYEVLFTDDALVDLEELDDYITTHDSPEKADYVLSMIEDAIKSLAQLPNRGSYPSELSELGIQDYREVFFKPYRVIYRVIGDKVYIYLIADGRRDMQSLLQRRLFSA